MLTTSMDPESSSKAAIVNNKIKIVGFGSVILSGITFLFSVMYQIRPTGSSYNNDPLSAAHFIVSLVTACISMYQVSISLPLLMFIYRIKNDHYYLSLWYISHLSILPLYWAMFCLEFYMCLNHRKYFSALLSGISIAVYQCIFTYFTVVIDKVMNGKYINN